jgi:Protein of unknown function (DUF3710)
VAIFRRRKDSAEDGYEAYDEEYAEYDDYPEDYHDKDGDPDKAGGRRDFVEDADGPFDESEDLDDGLPRLDLGSVRLPVPDGAQLQVEMDNDSGGIRAVHLLTEVGQLTVGAYAAPRSGGLWAEVGGELAEQLSKDGARVSRVRGEWGEELAAHVNDVSLRFVGVDGPRWMLRAVSAGPENRAEDATMLLRDVVRRTIVVRGDAPMPVRSPLPVQLPPEIADQIEQAKAQQEEQA